jgi:hypothetical protein
MGAGSWILGDGVLATDASLIIHNPFQGSPIAPDCPQDQIKLSLNRQNQSRIKRVNEELASGVDPSAGQEDDGTS